MAVISGGGSKTWVVALLVASACSSDPPSAINGVGAGGSAGTPFVPMAPIGGQGGAGALATAMAGTAPSPAGSSGFSMGTAGSAGAGMAGMMAPPTAPDADQDTIPDATDNCPMAANTDQADQDADMRGNACDNCPMAANADQRDSDKDGVGDVCACMNPIIPCENGKAGPYACSKIDLLAHFSLTDFGARSGNALWGFHDPESGREIAVVGLDNGTGFVDVTNPRCSKLVGKLPTASSRHVSRDVKAQDHYALVVSEAANHGLQIFDLRMLGNGPAAGSTGAAAVPMVTATVMYRGTTAAPVTNAHNIVVNEASGFIYLVGARSCSGGLHMIDFHDPLMPKFVGCVAETGYVHDAQCVMYSGPDTAHAGREICITLNGEKSAFSVVDVTDKSAPKILSTETYANGAYTHNGWFTKDQRYFLVGDELDEMRNGNKTRTFIFDLADLDNPAPAGIYTATTDAVDHNIYIRDDLVYQANYAAGLRILDASQVAMGQLREVAFFDTMPMTDGPEFVGAWTAYPWFDQGTVVVNGTEGGLFVLRPQADVIGMPAAAAIPGDG